MRSATCTADGLHSGRTTIASRERLARWFPTLTPLATGCTQGTSDPREVASRYDEWAKGYDGDLASWNYQAPAMVAETVPPAIPRRTRRSTSGAAPDWSAGHFAHGGSPGRSAGSTSRRRPSTWLEQSGAYDSVEQADLQQPLPLEDDSVDAVVCVGVMTYLPEVEAVWREFARVVRPRRTRRRDAARGPVGRPRLPGRDRPAAPSRACGRRWRSRGRRRTCRTATEVRRRSTATT